MPATRPAAKISSVHSISSFSMNGSPTCTLGRLAGPSASKVSDARTETPPMPSPPVRAPYRITWLPTPDALARCRSSCRSTPTQSALTSGLPRYGRVEDGLAADVGQAEAVAVAADAGDDPGQHPVGVVGVERAEAQRVHHRDRAGAHREDVADDAADAGRGALVGLDVRRVVVRLDLERDGVALADVEDAGVLADAGEHLADRGLLRDLGELLEVHLGATCRSSARSTSRSTSPARSWSAGGRGSRGSRRTRRASARGRPRAARARGPRWRRRRCREWSGGSLARGQSTGRRPQCCRAGKSMVTRLTSVGSPGPGSHFPGTLRTAAPRRAPPRRGCACRSGPGTARRRRWCTCRISAGRGQAGLGQLVQREDAPRPRPCTAGRRGSAPRTCTSPCWSARPRWRRRRCASTIRRRRHVVRQVEGDVLRILGGRPGRRPRHSGSLILGRYACGIGAVHVAV